MQTGNELARESLECRNLVEMIAWAKELDDEEVYRWATTLWEQRKGQNVIGTQIISISAAIAVRGFGDGGE